jgi:hypothetical protein
MGSLTFAVLSAKWELIGFMKKNWGYELFEKGRNRENKVKLELKNIVVDRKGVIIIRFRALLYCEIEFLL